jgi:mono/diheme cytochrome c family protein
LKSQSSLFIIFIFGAVSIAACEPAEYESADPIAAEDVALPSRADPTNEVQVATGERIYQSTCASCHGLELEGQPNWRRELLYGGYPAPPHNGTGHTWHHSDQHLFDATKLGGEASAGPDKVSRMVGFGDVLSDEEIWATLAYIKSHWSEDLLDRQRQASSGNADPHGGGHSHH